MHMCVYHRDTLRIVCLYMYVRYCENQELDTVDIATWCVAAIICTHRTIPCTRVYAKYLLVIQGNTSYIHFGVLNKYTSEKVDIRIILNFSFLPSVISLSIEKAEYVASLIQSIKFRSLSYIKKSNV